MTTGAVSVFLSLIQNSYRGADDPEIPVDIHMGMCTHIYKHTLTHPYTLTINTHTYIYLSHTHRHMHTHAHVHTRTHTDLYTYSQTHIQTYTHILRLAFF